jgi:hypothetical protein
LVKFQFFAFDPIRLYYVNVDMPPGCAYRRDPAPDPGGGGAGAAGLLREGEARSVTSLVGIKFTEMEPLYGDQYGQIAVSLNPATPEVRGLDEIIEAMRERSPHAGPGAHFLPQALRRAADRQAHQRQGAR